MKAEHKFIRGDTKADRLATDPFYAEDVAEVRAANQRSDTAYLNTLRQVRAVTNLSQAELAVKMGTDQGSISRIESRSDIKLSTLLAYVRAAGGTDLRLSFTTEGMPVEIDLNEI